MLRADRRGRVLTSIALLTLGIALLLAGGTALVRGASGIAAGAGVSPLVIGLTVVAFGTSAPELVVNVIGALRAETDIAFGNVAGSNLANLGLVLGASALLTPIVLDGTLIRRELPLLLLGTSILLVLTLDEPLRQRPAVIDRSDGAVLLLVFTIFLYVTIVDVLRRRRDPLLRDALERSPAARSSTGSAVLLTLAGVVGLTGGGQLTIDHGSILAARTGVPPTVIGLFVVAVGTSLPELVTSIVAATRREADLCVGNVVGSNLFNSLFVLPISALIHPLPVPRGGVGDLVLSFLFAAALLPIFYFGRTRMSRGAGAMLVTAYLGYAGLRLGTS
jgi:cation:H+ antiporter